MNFPYLVPSLLFLSILVTPALAQSPSDYSYRWPTEHTERAALVRNLVAEYSEPYGLSRSRQDFIISIINCENKELDPTLQSRIMQRDGTREESYGLAQIHLPSHPTITKEQATDPWYAIKFITTEVALGHENMWTCARMIQSRDDS